MLPKITKARFGQSKWGETGSKHCPILPPSSPLCEMTSWPLCLSFLSICVWRKVLFYEIMAGYCYLFGLTIIVWPKSAQQPVKKTHVLNSIPGLVLNETSLNEVRAEIFYNIFKKEKGKSTIVRQHSKKCFGKNYFLGAIWNYILPSNN